MADLQNILGTMLATGMGGRSGMGMENMGSILNNTGLNNTGLNDTGLNDTGFGAAPTQARSGMNVGSMAGLGALAYIAYRAFQERQRNMQDSAGPAPSPQPSPSGGGLWGGSSGGGILGSIFGGSSGGGSLGDRLSQVLQPRSAPQPEAGSEGAYPSLAMEDQHALLLIRAMIAAANADGQITAEERQRILSALDEAGAGPDERRIVEQELDRPQSLDSLVQAVHDPQTAEQVYMASMMAVDRNSDTERSYLNYLATRLRIDPQRLQQLNQAA
ncbi:tellurite resistance TerB family protein [Azospirillum sp. sgz302134]